MNELLKKLGEPFPPQDIEWRIGQCGTTKDGKPWAKVMAYIQARAVMDRLDAVMGPGNWIDSYREIKAHDGGLLAVVCKLELFIDGQWVAKEDVSEVSDIEPVKGAFSGALKRAGSKWNIARYLYRVESSFAECSFNKFEGCEYAKTKEGQVFYWKAPPLPSWALPHNVETSPKSILSGDSGKPKTKTEPQVLAEEKPQSQPKQKGELMNAIALEVERLKLTDLGFKQWVADDFKTTPGKLSLIQLAQLLNELQKEPSPKADEEETF